MRAMQYRLMRAIAAVAFLGFATGLHAKAIDRSIGIAGVTLHYKVVLPRDYDPAKTYPAVLAFPPGGQGADMVMTTLVRNWLPEAERRGFIVFVPAAPNGRLFFEEGARVFPEFLDKMLAEYKIRDNKFHVAGMSNGGISAFHVAAAYPQYFWSVTGFPGYLSDSTAARINALANMCINMHVGELDSGWLQQMKEQAAQFRAKGLTVRFTIEKGQSHVIGTLQGSGAARLFDQIEEARQGCTGRGTSAVARPAISATGGPDLARAIKKDLESISGPGTVDVNVDAERFFSVKIAVAKFGPEICTPIYDRERELHRLFPDLDFEFHFDRPALARAIKTDLESISGAGSAEVSIDHETLFSVRIGVPRWSSAIYTQLYDRALELYRLFPDLNFDFYLRLKP
jgi:pimeloyl-ACP methyl ester carboxylesterase